MCKQLLYFNIESLIDYDIATFHEKPSGKNTGIVNFVCEIPRLYILSLKGKNDSRESAKFEISKEDTLNPIHQDMKNGKPRYVEEHMRI